MKWSLDTSANVLVVFLCASSLLFVKSLTASRTTVSALVEEGIKAPAIDSVDYGASRTTLVVAVNSVCRYCTDSMPYYKEIADAKLKGVRIVVVSPDPIETTRQYLENFKVSADQIVQAPLVPLGITATPTLLVVTQDGALEQRLRGKLDDQQESALLVVLGRRKLSD